MPQVSSLQEKLRNLILKNKLLAPSSNALAQAAVPGLSLRASGRTPESFGSFLGGVPYLLAGQQWPLDSVGNPMLHLVQLNFAELLESAQDAGAELSSASLDGELPDSGLLQIFLGIDSNLGFDTEGMEMRFIPEPDGGFEGAGSAASAPDFFEATGDYDSPFIDPLAEIMEKPLGLEASFDLILTGVEFAFDNDLVTFDEENDEDEIYDAYDDFYYAVRKDSPIFLGGAPSFTQNYFFPEGHFHLIQFDSDGSEDWGTEMMWGDCGIAHLFVKNDALAKMRAGVAITLRSQDDGVADGAVWYFDCY